MRVPTKTLVFHFIQTETETMTIVSGCAVIIKSRAYSKFLWSKMVAMGELHISFFVKISTAWES